MNMYVGTDHPCGHWFRVPLGTTLRNPLMGLSGYRVTLGWLLPAHPRPVPFTGLYILLMYFIVSFNNIGHIVLWCQI